MLLLRITGNRIMYTNLTRNISARAQDIEYQLRKIYNMRVEASTHAQVKAMLAKAEGIAAVRRLADEPSPHPTRNETQLGKRTDHDSLPPEIQQRYVDNADIMRRMRECHTRLRMISSATSTCPDSDRYPFAEEIIALDKQYRTNWDIYDHYVAGTPVATVAPTVDARTANKNAEKTCHLLLGQYARKPSDSLADRIRATYASVASPSAGLATKMASANLL